MPKGDSGQAGTRPNEGLSPNTPVKAQGMRIEPPPSVPSVSGPMPAAIAAAAPPEEPPGVLAGFQGLRVMPVRGLSVTPFQPNSGVVVLPSRTASASRSRATTGASSFHGPFGSTVFEPLRVGQPRVSSRSLIETGTPSSAPRGSPFIQRASDSFAAASASGAMKQNAFSTGLSLSMRCKAARVTSSGEARLARYRRSSSVADRVSRSDAMDPSGMVLEQITA